MVLYWRYKIGNDPNLLGEEKIFVGYIETKRFIVLIKQFSQERKKKNVEGKNYFLVDDMHHLVVINTIITWI